MLFTGADVEEALRELVSELVDAGAEATIRIVGGAAVALQVGREALTGDIDALDASSPEVKAAVKRIADAKNWPKTWLNDATYGWNVGPNDEFMAVGRDQIREYALGTEMVADATRDDGSHYEIAGLGGGSWFRYAGDFKWSWQRDFFDVGNATATYFAMIKDGVLSEGMTKRIERAAAGERQPGHYRVGGAPVGLLEGV